MKRQRKYKRYMLMKKRERERKHKKDDMLFKLDWTILFKWMLLQKKSKRIYENNIPLMGYYCQFIARIGCFLRFINECFIFFHSIWKKYIILTDNEYAWINNIKYNETKNNKCFASSATEHFSFLLNDARKRSSIKSST